MQSKCVHEASFKHVHATIKLITYIYVREECAPFHSQWTLCWEPNNQYTQRYHKNHVLGLSFPTDPLCRYRGSHVTQLISNRYGIYRSLLPFTESMMSVEDIIATLTYNRVRRGYDMSGAPGYRHCTRLCDIASYHEIHNGAIYELTWYLSTPHTS